MQYSVVVVVVVVRLLSSRWLQATQEQAAKYELSAAKMAEMDEARTNQLRQVVK